ncbi:TIGR01777 family oxidoreductase [Niabella ginsengisoli]|uniref:TIGR01777 family oxidoreductase n=1 Tax=Niabella ginsengisoli TaxID=522298 RepID=A0ABS9SR99_9BACT|nr:TIGR01777 family oxidoreductase [Niabella ginsengisoli]MCH5600875.1 TIGR01777 family oxidoreductase [Niabella ginsengisoli]
MSTVLLTGGTGMIGTQIVKRLTERGYSVIVLTRNKSNKKGNIRYAHWDVEKETIDMDAVAEADFIMHLAGANIAGKRWTEERKRTIIESRVKSGELLVKTLSTINHKVKVFVSASAIGWYGADPVIPNSHPFEETFSHAKDFLGDACYKWEQSILPVTDLGIRLAIFRTGIVLSNEGGALKEFKRSLKLGVAAILGSGKQIISWIHIDDLVELYIKGIEDTAFEGIYNAVAPDPVSNKVFMKELAKESNKNFFLTIPVPQFVLKIILGEMSTEVLKSTTVSSSKAQHAGFKFSYPTIHAAIEQLLAQK